MIWWLVVAFLVLTVLLALGLGRWFKFMRDADARDGLEEH